ncbi:hypothetical protein M9458_007421, partial [Cirrhinus mrigala]
QLYSVFGSTEGTSDDSLRNGREPTAALSAEKPPVQDQFYIRMRDSKLLLLEFITLDLEMFSATPALELNRKHSYCQNHLKQHENLFSNKKHHLMDFTGHLQETMCPRHNKPLQIYCRTDQQCICMMCFVDEHKNHDTVSTAAERKEKQ